MPHLAGELLRAAAGIDITHVSYRGGAPLTTALLQNEVQLGFADLPILLPHLRAGALRALAVGTQQRLAWIPDVPTMAEVGLPSVDANNWHGFIAPAQVPEPILDKLHAAVAGALNDPEIRAGAEQPGRHPGRQHAAPNSPPSCAAELDKWGGVIQRSNIRAD